jgi:hypothetical protein
MSTTDLSNDPTRPSALVVYESMFGNTRAVAQAVALGLSGAFEVTLDDCGRAPARLPDRLALLVVGAPTHAFGLSREGTREDARRQCTPDDDPSDTGLREWLAGLPRTSASSPAPVTAAFDTKVSHPNLPGSAAHAAARRLHRLGYVEATGPRTFHVNGNRGPLAEGESDAAFAWGQQLAEAALLARGQLPAL